MTSPVNDIIILSREFYNIIDRFADNLGLCSYLITSCCQVFNNGLQNYGDLENIMDYIDRSIAILHKHVRFCWCLDMACDGNIYIFLNSCDYFSSTEMNM